MSDLILMQTAAKVAKQRTEELIAQYNSPEGQQLTQIGKRELIEQTIMFAFVEGYKCVNKSDEQIRLEADVQFLRHRLSKANILIEMINKRLEKAVVVYQEGTPEESIAVKTKFETECITRIKNLMLVYERTLDDCNIEPIPMPVNNDTDEFRKELELKVGKHLGISPDKIFTGDKK